EGLVLELVGWGGGEGCGRQGGQWPPTPQAERLAEDAARGLSITRCRKPTALRCEPAEARCVELILANRQQIARGARLDRFGAERAPELGDVRLNKLQRRRRRTLSPQLVDQAVPGDNL